MLHNGADHTTIAMHDHPARKPLSRSVNRRQRMGFDQQSEPGFPILPDSGCIVIDLKISVKSESTSLASWRPAALASVTARAAMARQPQVLLILRWGRHGATWCHCKSGWQSRKPNLVRTEKRFGLVGGDQASIS